MGFAVGEDFAVRDLAGGPVLFAWPLKTLADDDRGLLAAQVPGAVGMTPVGYPDDPDRLLKELSSGSPALVERAWVDTTAVSLFEEGQWWSTRMMWEASTGNLICYYVDFRRPIRRNGSCLDTLDLGLDLIAWGNGTWVWKDEDHLPLVRRLGWLSTEEEKLLDKARQVVVDAVETRQFPFDGSLLDLQPDPGALQPVLPADWNRAACA